MCMAALYTYRTAGIAGVGAQLEHHKLVSQRFSFVVMSLLIADFAQLGSLWQDFVTDPIINLAFFTVQNLHCQVGHDHSASCVGRSDCEGCLHYDIYGCGCHVNHICTLMRDHHALRIVL